jgi:glucose/arabinose dehydrogenase
MHLMLRRPLPLIAFVLALTAAPALAQTAMRSALHDFRLVPVVEGLVQPWAMAWLPNGDMLVTERPGRLRIVRSGKLLPQAVEGLPPLYTTGSQAGLFEVAVHPDFARNGFLYLTYAKPQADGQSTTALIRAKFENDRLTDVQPLFESVSKGRGHYGGKITFDGKGFLFLTLGDRMVLPDGDEAALLKHPAQDLTNHHGKLIRLHDDGRVPADNPFVATAGARPEIWSYGHRNVQGLVIHPATGDLWAHEHGPQGGDELNRIQKGKNYGWPVIGFGVNYTTGKTIHIGTMKEGMEQPAHVWVPSIGISGAMAYTGDRFPQWKGSLFVGGLAGARLDRLTVEGTTVTARETVAAGIGRVRDVRQGPDGFIYVAIEDRDGKPTGIHRLEPVERTTLR